MRTRLFLPLLASAMLAACAGESPENRATAQGEDSLPKPGASSGSVTGMPNPGTANAGPPAEDAIPEATPVLPVEAGPGITTLDPPTSQHAGVDPAVAVAEAQAVLRDYYAAISDGEHARAYSLWADQGRASGQSLQQFMEGFAPTDGVSVQLGVGRALGGSRGASLVEIPATVEGPQADGSVRRHAGTYTLRLDQVDASSQAQRWHIISADLREIRP